MPPCCHLYPPTEQCLTTVSLLFRLHVLFLWNSFFSFPRSALNSFVVYSHAGLWILTWWSGRAAAFPLIRHQLAISFTRLCTCLLATWRLLPGHRMLAWQQCAFLCSAMRLRALLYATRTLTSLCLFTPHGPACLQEAVAA